MGYPVNSVKNFEEHIKYSSSNKMALVFMANAYSDNRAVELVQRNFELMDMLSESVFFYLPGYHIAYNGRDVLRNEPMFEEEWFKENEKHEFADSHIENLNTTCIHSRRLGRVLFNEASFVDFVMEFSNKINGYRYLGNCQMILIPINSARRLKYDAAKVYDLDRIVYEDGGMSLDSFIFHIFGLLHNNDINPNQMPELAYLYKREYIFETIDRLYCEAIAERYYDARHDFRNEEAMRRLIRDIEQWLGWRLGEDFYFISYSSRNVMKAEYLKRKMQDRGYKVWMAPDGIPQGRDYAQTVPHVLRFAKHFVLILTDDSANSRWVKRELDMAINNEDNLKVKVLLADGFTIDKVRSNVELSFYLNNVQISFKYDDIVYDDEKFRRFIL